MAFKMIGSKSKSKIFRQLAWSVFWRTLS